MIPLTAQVSTTIETAQRIGTMGTTGLLALALLAILAAWAYREKLNVDREKEHRSEIASAHGRETALHDARQKDTERLLVAQVVGTENLTRAAMAMVAVPEAMHEEGEATRVALRAEGDRIHAAVKADLAAMHDHERTLHESTRAVILVESDRTRTEVRSESDRGGGRGKPTR